MDAGTLDAIETYLVCQVANAGGGAGSDQIKTYVADPNAELVVPDDQTLPAVAYQVAGAGPTVTWNTGTLLWQ